MNIESEKKSRLHIYNRNPTYKKMNKKIKIIIADDHQIVAGGIKAILDSTNSFTVLGIAENGKKVLELIEIEKSRCCSNGH